LSQPDLNHAKQGQTHTSKTHTPKKSENNGSQAVRHLAETQESEVEEQAIRQRGLQSEDREIPERLVDTQADVESPSSDEEPPIGTGRPLASCSIWVGSSRDADADQSRFEELSEEELVKRDGIGIVYMPLLPNPKVPGLDPTLISTWRREMHPEETEKLLTVAKV
jgi:cytosolic phospholipase A2